MCIYAHICIYLYTLTYTGIPTYLPTSVRTSGRTHTCVFLPLTSFRLSFSDGSLGNDGTPSGYPMYSQVGLS